MAVLEGGLRRSVGFQAIPALGLPWGAGSRACGSRQGWARLVPWPRLGFAWLHEELWKCGRNPEKRRVGSAPRGC